MRKTILRSALVLLAATSTAAAQRDTAFTWSRVLPEGSKLAIRNFNGPIDVREGTSDRVEVRATLRVQPRGNATDVSFDVREASPDNIEICTLFRGANCGPDMWEDIQVQVRYTVDLPKGIRLRVTTRSGSIIVMQSVAEVDATTGNGDVVIRESLSRVGASTGNGDVTVAAANGAVKASTGNGNVVVVTSRGPVDASSGNGDIDVKMFTMPPEDGLTSMTITTGHGTVRVALPADFNGELDATSGTHKITTDFDVRGQGRQSDSRLRGLIGSGNGPVVKVHSGSGRLEIRKR